MFADEADFAGEEELACLAVVDGLEGTDELWIFVYPSAEAVLCCVGTG